LLSRLRFAGATVMLGTLTQFDDLATGCAAGVGEVPWCHVEVPYTPIGRLRTKEKRKSEFMHT
jgi:hypothetical protein